MGDEGEAHLLEQLLGSLASAQHQARQERARADAVQARFGTIAAAVERVAAMSLKAAKLCDHVTDLQTRLRAAETQIECLTQANAELLREAASAGRYETTGESVLLRRMTQLEAALLDERAKREEAEAELEDMRAQALAKPP